MEFTAKQIAPPKDWSRFEDLCRSLFSAVWGDFYAQKNGRTGQPQHGVDIWGKAGGPFAGTHCIQCKGKDINYHGVVTPAEFDGELEKAERFNPTPALWVLATTAPNDARLQEHARKRSQEREASGKFAVTVLGWESLVALMGDHAKVIEQFYPEHGAHMHELLEIVRALPRRDDLAELFSSGSKAAGRFGAAKKADDAWAPVSFAKVRGLGPALLGRALGTADVGTCPRLPEAEVLERELSASYSARLAGVPGAGKSVCALQAAEGFARKGFRVVRLRDPRTDHLQLTRDDVPTVHLIDDAHLTASTALALAEQDATASKLLLSAFTTLDMGGTVPGTIHLDAKRAVAVIAKDLLARAAETLAAVSLIDDRVGEGIGEESLAWRLDTAAASEFPWQFCFVLSGGWRRVRALVASARAAKADLVLCAVAIRQLATRDSRAKAADLIPLFDAAGLDRGEAEVALGWLVDQRIVISATDLRCPHQRFAAEVFDPILTEQTVEGRRQVAAMMAHAVGDREMPLAGLGLLLAEFRSGGGSSRQWAFLVNEQALAPFLSRCWSAETSEDIAAAARSLREIDSYIPDAIKRPGRHAVETVARWFSHPRPGMAYAVGSYLNGTYRNPRYGRAIIRASDPRATADILNDALTQLQADFASEICKMVTQAFSQLTPEWKAAFLARVDRAKCLNLAAHWPAESSMYRASWFCEQFVHNDREFGLDLIAALAPAIGARMRADPVGAFDELEDIFWSSLRIYDPLRVYVGRLAPSERMRKVCGQLCAEWRPSELAATLDSISVRQFRDAAGLINVLQKSAPDLYAATVLAIDWDALDRAIGPDWSKIPHDAVTLLCQFYDNAAGKRGIAGLIDRHLDQVEVLDTSLAYLAPKSAICHVERGKQIALSAGHDDWPLRAGILANFHKRRRDLVTQLLAPHLANMATALSQQSPSYFERGLLFLKVCYQTAPEGFEAIVAGIDPANAAIGWTAALRGRDANGHKGRHKGAREAIAYLIARVRDRPGELGDLARSLAAAYPKETAISAKKLEPYADL